MRRQTSSTLLWGLPLVLLLPIFFWGLNFRYPIIGSDYQLFLPRLIAGRLHFAQQGFAPFLFSPHFCGGLPQYGNPHDLYHSLPQALALVFDPWIAIQLSIGFLIILGYWGWYRFARDVLRFETAWAHLLSLIVASNGFMFMHMVIGHFTFHTVPLMGLLLWLLLERRKDTVRALVWKAGVFAVLSAMALHAGYPMVLMFTAMFFLLILPLEFLLCGETFRPRFRTVALRSGAYFLAAALLGISKLVAVYSFMRFFPRDLPFNRFAENASTLLFVARSFWYIPQGRFLFAPAGVPWGVHEYSMFISPVTLMGAILGIPLAIAHRKNILAHWKHSLVVALYALLLLTFFLQLTRGYGILATPLESLPVFRSLHVTARFLYLLSLLVSIVGVFSIVKCVHVFGVKRWQTLILSFASALTVVALPIAYLPLLRSAELEWGVHYGRIRERLQSPDFTIQPVTHVREEHSSDIAHVLHGTTGVHCYEPLFGYAKDYMKYQITSLTEGPADKMENGFFNLNNPACFQYPEENNCRPGDRIAVTDRANFERFRRGEKTTWRVSTLQRAADGVSLVALVLSLLILLSRFPRKKVSL